MELTFVDYLFNRHYLVNDPNSPTENQAEIRLALGNIFNIRITSGADLLQRYMIREAEKIIGISVPRAFYQGFPESVRKLSKIELLIDQIIHYYRTYGSNDFSAPGHSFSKKRSNAKFSMKKRRSEILK